MTETSRPARDWSWTPSPIMNRVMSTLLRLPLAHRMLSSMMLLITFTGRKSGKQYTTPVGYLRDGNRVYIMTKRFRAWWHNFEQPASVTLRMAGQDFSGQASAVTDAAMVAQRMTQFIQARPNQAEIFEVRLLESGQPDPTSLAEVAQKVIVIEVQLAV